MIYFCVTGNNGSHSKSQKRDVVLASSLVSVGIVGLFFSKMMNILSGLTDGSAYPYDVTITTAFCLNFDTKLR